MDLKKLVVSTKVIEVEYPGIEGFLLKVQYLGKDQLKKIRDRCTTTKFDRKTRQLNEEVDQDLFIKEFVSSAVKGWKGLTYEGLSHLVPLEYDEAKANDLVPYSVENAITLVENSSEADSWLNDTVFDLENFRTKSAKLTV